MPHLPAGHCQVIACASMLTHPDESLTNITKMGFVRCWEREKIDGPVGADNFYFLLCLVNFHKPLASGKKIKF